MSLRTGLQYLQFSHSIPVQYLEEIVDFCLVNFCQERVFSYANFSVRGTGFGVQKETQVEGIFRKMQLLIEQSYGGFS